MVDAVESVLQEPIPKVGVCICWRNSLNISNEYSNKKWIMKILCTDLDLDVWVICIAYLRGWQTSLLILHQCLSSLDISFAIFFPFSYMDLNWFVQGQVTQKISSRGKYVSVKIGPIRVVSSEQVATCFLVIKYILLPPYQYIRRFGRLILLIETSYNEREEVLCNRDVQF